MRSGVCTPVWAGRVIVHTRLEPNRSATALSCEERPEGDTRQATVATTSQVSVNPPIPSLTLVLRCTCAVSGRLSVSVERIAASSLAVNISPYHPHRHRPLLAPVLAGKREQRCGFLRALERLVVSVKVKREFLFGGPRLQ